MPPRAVWEVGVEQRKRVEFENLDYQEKVAKILWYASAIAMAPRGPSVSVGGSKSKRQGKPNQ